MAEVRLTADEAAALRSAVSEFLVQGRTGSLGIMHAGRFVSTLRILRKAERNALDAAARKLGLAGLAEYGG